MALNLKNPEVEQLAAEVAELASESKTEAIRKALLERRSRLLESAGGKAKGKNLRELLERNVWPFVPAEHRGKPVSREEEDEILGYGPTGFCL